MKVGQIRLRPIKNYIIILYNNGWIQSWEDKIPFRWTFTEIDQDIIGRHNFKKRVEKFKGFRNSEGEPVNKERCYVEEQKEEASERMERH